jgi:proteic killer suppression protein
MFLRLTNNKELVKHYGLLAKRIKQRLLEIEAAENLKQLSLLPSTGFHGLKGKFENCFSLRISGNYRIIIKPEFYNSCEEIKLEEITSIIIIDILDYH